MDTCAECVQAAGDATHRWAQVRAWHVLGSHTWFPGSPIRTLTRSPSARLHGALSLQKAFGDAGTNLCGSVPGAQVCVSVLGVLRAQLVSSSSPVVGNCALLAVLGGLSPVLWPGPRNQGSWAFRVTTPV